MTQARWQRIKTLFEEARRRAPGERAAFVEASCAGDSGLREEVRSLLRAAEDTARVDDLAQAWVSPLLRDLRGRGAYPELGASVGPYQLVDEVGRGGMGAVFRARDARLERDVALKLIDPSKSARHDARARFLAEARAASALDHPNVCTIYEAGETEDGRLYIAMAFYEGPTLAGRLRDGPLTVEESIELAIQIARGLQCAHDAGIVHRDVKPSNVVVTGQGIVKILDFGIAKLEGGADLTKAGARLGTVAYMAPEQARGEPVDARTDLWALGVVLYEMLTGKCPFTGAYDHAVLHAILHAEPSALTTLRPDIPADVDPIVRRALMKDPERRFQHAGDLVTALRAVGTKQSIAVDRGCARLPTPLTSLVGRDAEIERARALLDRVRLLTLTGPGGIGKTRLAIELAARVAPDYPDGAFFVGLASVTDPAQVAYTIARGLGVPDTPGRPVLDDLKRVLGDRRMLLVLDNFEQVQAAASVVVELLTACPGLDVLVTSRTPLGAGVEQEFPVPPLDGPDGGAEPVPEALLRCTAVRLFVERARSVRPDFDLTPDNAAAVAALCNRLDGLPLAIELAAARIKMFSPEVLLDRLTSRLDVLKGGTSDRPARHRTLQEAMAWSYDLLDEGLQYAFRQLSVFSGGFTLEAAEAVVRVDDVVDAVAALLDHSLLRRSSDERPLRYHMLETIHTYGLTRLQRAREAQQAQRRHARYFLEQAEDAEPHMTGPDQAAVFDRLEAEHNNLRAALSFAEARGDAELALRLGAALWRFWLVRNYVREGRQWMQRCLALPGDVPPAVRAHALNGIATIAHNQGDNIRARRYLEESLSMWRRQDDRGGVATVLNNLSWVGCELSDFGEARRLAEEALTLCRELDDRRGTALALNNLGWVAWYRGEASAARTFHEQSLAIRREIGDRRGIAFALANVANAERISGHYVRAERLVDEALRTTDEEKDPIVFGWTRAVQAQVYHDQGVYDRAAEILDANAFLDHEVGNRSGIAWTLTDLGHLALDQNDAARARRLLEKAVSIWQDIHCPWGVGWAKYGLGRVVRAEHNYEVALDRFRESLAIREQLGDRRGQAECLEAMALVEIERKRLPEARGHMEAATSIRTSSELPVPPNRADEVERVSRVLEAHLAPDVASSAKPQ